MILPPENVVRNASLRSAILFIIALLHILALVRRHVSRAAVRTIIVALRRPHVRPFSTALGAFVVVPELHDRPPRSSRRSQALTRRCCRRTARSTLRPDQTPSRSCSRSPLS